MMEHPFPPPSPISSAAVCLHVVILALVVASLIGVFVKRSRPVRSWDFAPWLAAIVLVTFLAPLAIEVQEAWTPLMLGYMFFVWIVAGIGLGRCLIRLRRIRKSGLAWTCVLTTFCFGMCCGLFWPMLAGVHETAARSQCRGNLKQIGLAFHNSHDVHGHIPLPIVESDDLPDRSWRVELLPFLGRPDVRSLYVDEKSWDDAANHDAAATLIIQYHCPSNQYPVDAQDRYFTAYALSTGPGTVFSISDQPKFSDMSDGTSNTLLVGEACGREIVWTEPRDLDAGSLPIGVNRPGEAERMSHGLLSSYHEGGVHVLMGDGSATFLSENIDEGALRAITTAAAGDDAGRF